MLNPRERVLQRVKIIKQFYTIFEAPEDQLLYQTLIVSRPHLIKNVHHLAKTDTAIFCESFFTSCRTFC